MKRKTKKGVGITILNNRMYSKGWRPILPLEFERSYPKLCELLKKCWAHTPEDRPSFDQIVKTMQGEVAEEEMRKEEPAITVYSVEDDGEEGMDTAKMVSQRVHTETLEKKDLVIKELEGFQETMEKKERIHTRDAGEEEGCCH